MGAEGRGGVVVWRDFYTRLGSYSSPDTSSQSAHKRLSMGAVGEMLFRVGAPELNQRQKEKKNNPPTLADVPTASAEELCCGVATS